MKALVRSSAKRKDIRFCEYPKPELLDDCAIVEMKYAGICGFDIDSYNRDLKNDDHFSLPVIPGHEGSGIIHEIHPHGTTFEVGQPVIFETTFSVCGQCSYCKKGNINLCPERTGIGSRANGCFAEFVLVPCRFLHKIPSGIDLKIAALTEPLACAVHAVFEIAKVEKNQTAIVFGPGTMGILIAILLNHIGVKVTVVGTPHSQHRLQLIQNQNIADVRILDSNDSPNENLSDAMFADVAFECSGNSSALISCLNCLKPLGKLIVVGDSKNPIQIDVRKFLLNKELSFYGSKSSRSSSYTLALDLIFPIYQRISTVISHIFPFEEWENAFAIAENRTGIKVLLNFNTDHRGRNGKTT